MLELYHSRVSTCSQKVRLCLAEKGVDWVERLVDLKNNAHLDPAYLRLNPNGVVPTLVHDGAAVIDSSVIIEYLDERFPGLALSPPTALGRARMRSWLRYFEEVPTVAVRFPSYNQVFLQFYRGLSDDQVSASADARPLRKHFYRRFGKQGFVEEEVLQSIERMSDTIRRMDIDLSSEGPWLLGEQLTLADLCVAPLIDRMDDLGHACLWADHAAFARWLDRLRARPSWKKAFVPGSRLSEIYRVQSLN